MAPNSNLQYEGSQSNDPRQYFQTALGVSLTNDTQADPFVIAGARPKIANQPKAQQTDKVAGSLEEFVELLATRIVWLDQRNLLTNHKLNQFCDSQPEELVDEVEKVMVINVNNIKTHTTLARVERCTITSTRRFVL